MKLKQVLEHKYKEGRALVAFNIQNIHQLKALLDTAKGLNGHAIAQFSAKLVPFLHELYGFPSLVKKYQSGHLFFHLDHCSDPVLIRQCVDFGFASVMYDGSALPLIENIWNTNAMFEYASAHDCLLEAELGAIGGVEDGQGTEQGSYFSMEELGVFVKEARFDMLALAIGNAHGFYKTTEVVRPDLLSRAKEVTGPCYFVLHGGSGLPEEVVREALDAGVVKINISTELKQVTQRYIQEYSNKVDLYDELELFNEIRGALHPFFTEYLLKYTETHVPGN